MKAILAALTICCLLGCQGESPEAQVKKAFEGCVKAVESQDAAGAVAPLAKDFQGPEGLDRSGARLYLLGILRREKVGITVLGNKVEVRDREALQVVELVLTSKGETLLPQDATHRVYHLRWRLEEDEWRLYRFEQGH